MSIVEQQVDARERASVLTTSVSAMGSKPRRQIPTAATLVASNSELISDQVICVYCDQGHTSSSCTTVTDINA